MDDSKESYENKEVSHLIFHECCFLLNATIL